MSVDLELDVAPLRPTTDLAQARRDLDEAGFCIVKDALSPSLVAELKAKVIQQADGEAAAGVAWYDSKTNQRIWMLPNKGQIFRELAVHPLADELIGYLLGEDFLLSSLTANIARPGGDPMGLHSDQGYIDYPTPKPAVANILWMLDGFTDANGGTRVIPGSHRFKNWRAETGRPTIAAEGPPGAALIFDGRLIHGTGANRTTGEQRRAILTYYCSPFVRQQENYFLGLDPRVEPLVSDELKRRMGYSVWRGLGRTETPLDQGLLARVSEAVCELDRDGQPIGPQ